MQRYGVIGFSDADETDDVAAAAEVKCCNLSSFAMCVQDLICKFRYYNTLPDLPFDPKMLAYPFDPMRFVKYRFVQKAKHSLSRRQIDRNGESSSGHSCKQFRFLPFANNRSFTSEQKL